MKRHLIYTNGRSGSNALTNLLSQHPNLVNYGEVLGPWTTPGKYVKPLFAGPDGGTRYLDFVLGSRPAFTAVQCLSFLNRRRTGRPTVYRRWADTTSVGIKEFAVNFHRHGLERYLDDNPDLSLVVLLRENPVERYISSRRLSQTGVVSAKAGQSPADQRTFAMVPERIISDLDRFEHENDLLRRAARTHQGPTMLIRYEEYFVLEGPELERATGSIQEFLGVPALPLSTTHRKLRSAHPADSISNYAEFREVVAASRYARWLEG